jgi:hypothetical protein
LINNFVPNIPRPPVLAILGHDTTKLPAKNAETSKHVLLKMSNRAAYKN